LRQLAGRCDEAQGCRRLVEELAMTETTPTDFGPRDIYRSFRAERNQALHRVLRRLPFQFVVALIEGLEGADVITPGRLFAGHRGGCAVGVTLRAIDPGLRGRRLIWGRRLHRSIKRLRRSLAREVPHLYALEHVFDRSVFMLQARFPHVPANNVAEATALWVAGEARAELILRELHSEWLDRILDTQTEEAGAAPSPTLVAQPA
jgi:hypothetical protein